MMAELFTHTQHIALNEEQFQIGSPKRSQQIAITLFDSPQVRQAAAIETGEGTWPQL